MMFYSLTTKKPHASACQIQPVFWIELNKQISIRFKLLMQNSKTYFLKFSAKLNLKLNAEIECDFVIH